MTYHEMRKVCQTGDVLGVKGEGAISWLIKKVTKEEYSHVAALVWHFRSLSTILGCCLMFYVSVQSKPQTY